MTVKVTMTILILIPIIKAVKTNQIVIHYEMNFLKDSRSFKKSSNFFQERLQQKMMLEIKEQENEKVIQQHGKGTDVSSHLRLVKKTQTHKIGKKDISTAFQLWKLQI